MGREDTLHRDNEICTVRMLIESWRIVLHLPGGVVMPGVRGNKHSGSLHFPDVRTCPAPRPLQAGRVEHDMPAADRMH